MGYNASTRREVFVNTSCLILVLKYGQEGLIREGLLKY